MPALDDAFVSKGVFGCVKLEDFDLPDIFRIMSQIFLMGVLLLSFEKYDLHDFRFVALIVRRALALNIFTSFNLFPVGNLQNRDSACFLCFIASLHSLLYHGLLFLGFVEVLGIHDSDILIREDVKSATRSEDSFKLSMFKRSSQREINNSQSALFNFHFVL